MLAIGGIGGGFLLGMLIGAEISFGMAVALPLVLGGLGAWWGAKADQARYDAQAQKMLVSEEQARSQVMQTHLLDEVVVNVESDQFVGIAWDARKIVAQDAGGAVLSFSFEALTDVELEVQTDTSSQTEGQITTNRGSQLFGVAVGGAAFGVGGAVVGGLTGSQRTSSVTTSNTSEVGYILRCRFLDRRNPIVETVVYRAGVGVHCWQLLAARQVTARRFHAHLSNILHENRTR